MGDLRKKLSGVKFALLCLAVVICLLTLSCGSVLVTGKASLVANLSLMQSDDDDKMSGFFWTYGGLYDTGFELIDFGTMEIRITNEKELACLSYLMTTGVDFSGYTISLLNDLDLGKSSYATDSAFGGKLNWKPIPVGYNGKNTNIVFNGNGNKIKGLTMKLEYRGEYLGVTGNTTETAVKVYEPVGIDDEARGFENLGDSVGLFSNLVGGAVRDVIFESPVIEYQYTNGEEYYYDANNKIVKVSKPIEVNIGVVAGKIQGTSISNVIINNPKISLETNNINGHNFNVGAVVGKMENNATTVGLVDAATITGGEVTMQINAPADEDAEEECGTAVKGNLGGIVGENNTARVANCIIKNVAITQKVNNREGEYCVGGIAGLSQVILSQSQQTVVGGVFNNLVMTDEIAAIDGNKDTLYGLITGKAYQCWVHSNVYIGTLGYELFGPNGCYTNLATFEDGCAALYGGLNSYFKSDSCTLFSTKINGESFEICGAGHQDINTTFRPDFMAKNYKYTTIAAMDAASVNGMSLYTYLSDFESEKGGMYEIGKEIAKYEYGSTSASNLRDAVDIFRVWVKNGGTIEFGNSLSLTYPVEFDGNGGGWLPIDEDHDDDDDDDDIVYDEEYFIDYESLDKTYIYAGKYRDSIDLWEVPEPIKEGHKFVGWYKNADCKDGQEWKFSNDPDPDKVGTEKVTLYAKWEVLSYTVTFYAEEGQFHQAMPNIKFGTTFSAADKPYVAGKVFQGWFTIPGVTDTTLGNEKLAWNFETQTMPAYDLDLYAGWQDNYLEIRTVWEDSKKYLDDEKYYTAASIKNLKDARDAIDYVIQNEQKISESEKQKLIGQVESAISGLVVNIDLLKEHEAIKNEDSYQNKYPFLWTKESYEAYSFVKSSVLGYIEEFSGVNERVEDLKTNYLRLVNAYNNLQKNPNLKNANGTYLSDNDLKLLVEQYEEWLLVVNTYTTQEYVENEAWRAYQAKCMEFMEAFARQEPTYENLKAVMANLGEAVKALQGTGITPSGVNGNAGKGGFSPISFGFIMAFLAVLAVGGWVGYDLYRNLYVPKYGSIFKKITQEVSQKISKFKDARSKSKVESKVTGQSVQNVTGSVAGNIAETAEVQNLQDDDDNYV